MLLSKRRGIVRFFLREMMASAAVIRNDVFLYRGFQIESPSSSSSSEQFCFFKFPVSTRYSSTTSTVRGCFDSDTHNSRDPCRRSLHTNSSKANNGGRRSSGFDHHKAQFVRDLELEGIPALQDVRTTTDARSLAPNGSEPAAYGRGNLLGFPNHSLPRDKVAVAVDVDEVLGNFVSALNRFIADRYSSNHSVSEYHVYEFFKIWNCSRDEGIICILALTDLHHSMIVFVDDGTFNLVFPTSDIRVHEFFKTSYFKTGIHPLPGAQKALHKLSRFCNLSVVTSRQNAIKDHTIEWIERHYPGLFQEIHFGNHFALDGVSRPKSDICRSLGAKFLIDDNPRYAIECAEVGIRVLLFDYENSYPWCKTDSINQHPLVTKVHNWEEVEQQLNRLVFH
ncbi:5'(3')-deoxyribonucleotidase [Trema orientale]|uniref:5'(3')-deoxyribonucleotidase n=1 Tax=Trema orientale TaxID=63057 RepID=A0A2P5ARM8_TREOI|nr:5'(3')-deoxyribonucleotidase [Trema orientale]